MHESVFPAEDHCGVVKKKSVLFGVLLLESVSTRLQLCFGVDLVFFV